jgi:hypothetical protein
MDKHVSTFNNDGDKDALISSADADDIKQCGT